MPPEREGEPVLARPNPFTTADVEKILREHGWLTGNVSPEQSGWLASACVLLGPQAAHSAIPSEAASALASLLELIFDYDANAIFEDHESHVVMAREGARDVVRELANRVLGSSEINSDRYKEIIEEMKTGLGFHGRKLFHPIRLALAGRAGEGELDRVILLLDSASKLGFVVPVKGTSQRMIEFCAGLE